MQQVWEFISKGGIVMIPLIFCSVAFIAIVIEKMISLRRRKVIVPEVVGILENIRSEADIGLALAVCEKHRGPLANITRLSLEKRALSREEIKEELLDQSRQEVYALERGLPVLETIASIAPLLGLLGTVLGILKVFNVISVMGVGQAAALSGGISEALITTIFGLSIGIPAVVGYNYFSSKAEALVLEIEKLSNRLLGRLDGFAARPER